MICRERLRELVLFNSQERILKGKYTQGWEYIFSISKEKVLFSRSMEDRTGICRAADSGKASGETS